jgi:hypothetical protein
MASVIGMLLGIGSQAIGSTMSERGICEPKRRFLRPGVGAHRFHRQL